jgi:D-methionine transport system substrate-binding protein
VCVMKKVLLSALSIIFIIVLSACNSTESSSTVEKKEIVLGATVPYSDMLEKGVKPLLEEKGYKVEVKEFNDYVQPNLSLGSGSLDGNLFQHKVYMEAFAKEHNLELSEVITVPTAPIGIYSEKYKSLDEIEDGSTVAIANDPTNLARHLKVLNDAGVIKFSDSVDPLRATVKDISENPKNLKFKEIEAAQLPRTLGSVDLVAINGNFAIAAGLDLTTALAVDQLPPDFLNRVIVRTEDLDQQFVKDIKEAVESDEFRKVINEDFKGFTKPDWIK